MVVQDLKRTILIIRVIIGLDLIYKIIKAISYEGVPFNLHR
jgi:hypothetical protein